MEQSIQAAPLMRKPSEPTATTHVPLNTKRSAGAACDRGMKENHALPANFGRASVPIMASRPGRNLPARTVPQAPRQKVHAL